jgi:hypothetical protein
MKNSSRCSPSMDNEPYQSSKNAAYCAGAQQRDRSEGGEPTTANTGEKTVYTRVEGMVRVRVHRSLPYGRGHALKVVDRLGKQYAVLRGDVRAGELIQGSKLLKYDGSVLQEQLNLMVIREVSRAEVRRLVVENRSGNIPVFRRADRWYEIHAD